VVFSSSLLCLALGHATAQAPASGSPSSAPLAGAIISEWTGDARVQLPRAAPTKPQRGQVIPVGSIIDTGNGTLLVILRADESEILVQPHTHLLVKEPASGSWSTLDIIVGRVRAYIRKRTGGAPPFQMATPSAVIAVRGTRFDVSINSHGVSEIDVFEGLVEVAGTGIAAGSVLVNPGFSTRVALGKAPEPPVPTSEIRPSVDIPEDTAKQEFNREQKTLGELDGDHERGESASQERREQRDDDHGAQDVD